MLLGAIERRASGEKFIEAEGSAGGTADGDGGVRAPRRRCVARAIAARAHAAFSAMIYAGLRIEETTALTVKDFFFARGAEEVRVAKGKGNKERLVPMGPRLRRSLRSYLKARGLSCTHSTGPRPKSTPPQKDRRLAVRGRGGSNAGKKP